MNNDKISHEINKLANEIVYLSAQLNEQKLKELNVNVGDCYKKKDNCEMSNVLFRDMDMFKVISYSNQYSIKCLCLKDDMHGNYGISINEITIPTNSDFLLEDYFVKIDTDTFKQMYDAYRYDIKKELQGRKELQNVYDYS